MKSLASPPYLLPPEDAISASDWSFPDGEPVGDRLAHWDPFATTAFERTIRVDLDAVRRACALGPDSCFVVNVAALSSRTRLTTAAPVVGLGDLDGVVEAPVTITVEGWRAGGRLTLRTDLVLADPGGHASPISPRRVGVSLWADQHRLALEGSAARFPISAVEFDSIPRLPTGALWALDWNPEDLGAPVLGGLRLLVNAGHDGLVAALRSGTDDLGARYLWAFLQFDVARNLIHGALTSDSFLSAPESFDDGTVGRLVTELTSSCWPGVSAATLAARLRDDPARLDAEIQAHLEPLG